MLDWKQIKKVSKELVKVMWKRAENYGTYFWVSSLEGSHTRCEDVKTGSQAVTYEDSNRKRERLCLLSLFSRRFIYLYLAKAVDSVHNLFSLSSVTIKKGCSK